MNQLKIYFFFLLILCFSCKKNRDEPAPTKGNVEGRVIGRTSSDVLILVSDAEITFDGQQIISSELGKFEFENIKAGSYDAIVEHTKYYPDTINITVKAGETISADVILNASPSILAVQSIIDSSSLDTLDFDTTTTELEFKILNEGGETLTWSIEDNKDWLDVNNIAGTGNATIRAEVNRNLLTSQYDTATITITNVSNKNEKKVIVTTQLDIENNLKKGLLAYYPFNGNTNDESGNDYHGVNGSDIHAATLTTDRNGDPNSAYEFDGDDIVDIPNHVEMNYLEEFSMSVWVQPSTFKSSMTIFMKDNPYKDMFLSLENLKPHYEFNRDIGAEFHTVSEQIDTSIWSNIIFIKEGALQTFYLNGEKINQKTKSLEIGWLSEQMAIGAYKFYHERNDFRRSFIGEIDEVRIYDRVLLPDEIKYLYEN